MANLKVKLYSPGMAEMMKSEKVTAELERIAERDAAAARASAPVESGAYRDSIRVEMTTAAALGIKFRRGGNDRPVAVVVAASTYVMNVEASTGNLARNIDAAKSA